MLFSEGTMEDGKREDGVGGYSLINLFPSLRAVLDLETSIKAIRRRRMLRPTIVSYGIEARDPLICITDTEESYEI